MPRTLDSRNRNIGVRKKRLGWDRDPRGYTSLAHFICVQMICPTGKVRQFLSSPHAKNISLVASGKSPPLVPASCPTRGRIASRHETRDGMWWTRVRRRARWSQGEVKTRERFTARRTNDAKARRSLLAKTGGCVRQKRVVLAPVAGVKLPVADAIQPDCFSRQAGSDGDKTNSSPGRARHKP